MGASPQRASTGRKYKPGQPVPETGVYRVIHHQHRPEHDATLFRDEQFPPCGRCGEDVRFELVGKAVPIEDDSDFQEVEKHVRSRYSASSAGKRLATEAD